jgi:hypothetical protein
VAIPLTIKPLFFLLCQSANRHCTNFLPLKITHCKYFSFRWHFLYLPLTLPLTSATFLSHFYKLRPRLLKVNRTAGQEEQNRGGWHKVDSNYKRGRQNMTDWTRLPEQDYGEGSKNRVRTGGKNRTARTARTSARNGQGTARTGQPNQDTRIGRPEKDKTTRKGQLGQNMTGRTVPSG